MLPTFYKQDFNCACILGETDATSMRTNANPMLVRTIDGRFLGSSVLGALRSSPITLCQAPAGSVLGPGGFRQSLCRVCAGPRCSVAAVPAALSAPALRVPPVVPRAPRSGPPAPGPQLRSACHPSCPGPIRSTRLRATHCHPAQLCHLSGFAGSYPRATHPVTGPQLRSVCQPSNLARSVFQERTPNLTVWGRSVRKYLI